MNNIFKDEVIYITGASAGIGFATAKVCMKRGATVVITGRNAENLKQAELELQKISPNVIAHNLDVSDESAISDSLNEIYKICGKVDGLVNNAPSIHTGKIVDLSLSAWKTNFKANLDAVFLTTKTVLPWMMAVKKGSIVNNNTKISSHSFICSGVTIGEDCFIGHGVMFTNDKFDSDVLNNWILKKTIIGNNVRIGSNSTILPIIIEDNVIIGAGSVVTKNIKSNLIICGNPAKILKK